MNINILEMMNLTMKIIKEESKSIDTIVKFLSQGKLVFLASETVYIAAVDATNRRAVQKLIAFKNRPFGKPFSIAVTDINMAKDYVDLNPNARSLYKKFLPGPVTVISQGKHKVAPGVEAENGSLGIRISDYEFLLKVIKEFGKPITATSANAAYQKRPYKLNDILENISAKQKSLVDLMVDAGELPHNEPSTVIDTTLDNENVILRQGEVKLKDTNEVLSRSEENTQNIAKEIWQKYSDFQGQRAIIFALQGKMGAGKTQFVKGLANAMGIQENVVSPSYDLLLSYGKLTHIDIWRMLDPEKELENLKIKDYLKDKDIVAIEWADRAKEVIRTYLDDAIIIWVRIEYAKNTNERVISWGNL